MSDVRFIHAYFVGDPKARATVAWRMAPGETNQIQLGISWCSPRDHFRKDKGRLIAEGRLNKKPLQIAVDLSERDGKTFVEERTVLSTISSDKGGVGAPRWARGDVLFIQKKPSVQVLRKEVRHA